MTLNQVRVLVVDDDPLSRELIHEFLEDPRYGLVSASDGLEAWRLLDQDDDKFDVVLLDRMMPRMTGLEVLERMKRHPRLKALPVIMQTAAADKQHIIEGINAGAYYYLTKPFDSEMLVSIVGAAASDYERFRELQRQVQRDAVMLNLMRSARFEFRSPDEAHHLGPFLAKACPDPERVVVGLSELLINAVEHGNLEISYQEKTELNRTGRWQEEIERRLSMNGLGERVVSVRFERHETLITITIEDQGAGFDPRPYLQIDPSRVFDSHGRGIAIANLLSFDCLEYHKDGRQALAVIEVR